MESTKDRRRKVFTRLALISAVALYATTAQAMATIEFMKLGVSEQMDVVQPIMVSFLAGGCKKIPDNSARLVREMKKLAYEKGYTYQNVEGVAKEAATGLGMTC